MDSQTLYEEAEQCRRQALSYLGRHEAKLLLHAAREFQRLAENASSLSRRRGDPHGTEGANRQAAASTEVSGRLSLRLQQAANVRNG